MPFPSLVPPWGKTIIGTNGMYKGACTTVSTVVLFVIVKDFKGNLKIPINKGICKETMI